MIIDTNSVSLSGRINDVSFYKAKNGNVYATFSMAINRLKKEPTWLRIMVFDEIQVEYLKNVNAHKGDRVWVHGMMSQMSSGGKNLMQIQVTDLGIARKGNDEKEITSDEIKDAIEAQEIDENEIF